MSTISVSQVLTRLWGDYTVKTPTKIKVIDVYLVYVFATAVVQFTYCCLVGNFPFNSFLAGFISCVGSFVLAVSLRIQTNPENKTSESISTERAFAEFIFCNLLLHLVVMHFLG
eukprot:Colp12_sorted_trinity150504_noHs@5587